MNWKPFKSKSLYFSLNHPEDWEARAKGNEVVFEAPAPETGRATQLWVQVERLDKLNKDDHDPLANLRKKALNKPNGQPKIEFTSVGDYSGVRSIEDFQLDSADGPLHIRAARMKVIHEELQYDIVFIANAANYEEHFEVVEEMLDSFASQF